MYVIVKTPSQERATELIKDIKTVDSNILEVKDFEDIPFFIKAKQYEEFVDALGRRPRNNEIVDGINLSSWLLSARLKKCKSQGMLNRLEQLDTKLFNMNKYQASYDILSYQNVEDIKKIIKFLNDECILVFKPLDYNNKDISATVVGYLVDVLGENAIVALFERRTRGNTFKAIGMLLGLSGGRIGQIESSAIMKLKHPKTKRELLEKINSLSI